MKLWFWLAGGVVTLLAAWLALRGEPQPAPVAVVHTGSAAVHPAPAAAPAAPVQAVQATPAPRGVRVHGVLQHGGQAQALLSVEGNAAHVFAVGDAVAQGWKLASVAPDHVVLALGEARARVDVSYSVQSAPAAPAAALASAQPQTVPVGLRTRSAVMENPAPGFVPAAQGTVERRPSTATNRRFLEDHQKRMAAGKPQERP